VTPATPYARARDQGRAALRRALLDAAGRLLTDEGPGALTMRRIAAEVGCSTTVLYTLFENKANLADALYLEGFDRLRRTLEAVPRSGDPLADLRDLGRAYRASALANPSYYGVMFGRPIPGFVPPPESREQAGEALAILVRAVAACVGAGAFRAEDPRATAEVLWAAVHGAVSLELAGYVRDPAAAERRFETAAAAARAWFRADDRGRGEAGDDPGFGPSGVGGGGR
jgi:AcrR family transcriptional regulator